MIKKLHYTYFTGALVYGFGILGILSPFKSWFVAMTPASLLLTLGLLIWNQGSFSAKYWYFSGFALLTGLLFEIVGVNTGFPFGDYQYGPVLGPKIFHTPLLIGVNWLLITQSSNDWLHARMRGRHPLLLIFLGALLPTLADVLIEPVAIALNFWSWDQGLPPLQNYLGWFGVSLLISIAYQRWIPGNQNPASGYILALQCLFFGVLRVFLS